MTQPSGASPSPDRGTSSPSRYTRRGLVFGALGVLLIGGVGSARWFNVAAQVAGDDLTAQQALTALRAGRITMVDVRRPDEWARTGVAEGALPIDMRRKDFVDALLAQIGGDTSTPIAVICARGDRSARLAKQLRKAGFTQLIDVPEGMLGSGAGPGWVKRGLPVYYPG